MPQLPCGYVVPDYSTVHVPQLWPESSCPLSAFIPVAWFARAIKDGSKIISLQFKVTFVSFIQQPEANVSSQTHGAIKADGSASNLQAGDNAWKRSRRKRGHGNISAVNANGF
jgi:hypothetical protein